MVRLFESSVQERIEDISIYLVMTETRKFRRDMMYLLAHNHDAQDKNALVRARLLLTLIQTNEINELDKLLALALDSRSSNHMTIHSFLSQLKCATLSCHI